MDVNKKYGGVIKNWYSDGVVVRGDLYGDPNQRFPEGTFIRTSKVVDIDLENMKVETLNTIYDLGGVSGE